jgi:hypothetical protein
MHSIVPILGLSGHLALHMLASGGSAISHEASEVHRAANEVVKSDERSQALFGEKAAALWQLAVLQHEYSEPGWNGEDAAPLDPTAVLLAARFLRMLPQGIPLPELAPEPDGSISLDWIQSPKRLFTLSIGRSNRLPFAWLDGADKGHGVAHFDGKNIPSRILRGIEDVVRWGDVGVRTA